MTAVLPIALGVLAGFGVYRVFRTRAYAAGVRAGQRLTENALGREVTDFPAAVTVVGRLLGLLNPPRAPGPLVDRFDIQHFRPTDEPSRTTRL